MTEARVVGAGVSGLVAAWCLADLGCHVTVIEAGPKPGGLVRTLQAPEGLVECGPNAMRWTDATERWFGRLKLAPAFPHKVHRRRYVYRAGRLRRWPLSPMESVAAGARLAYAATTRSLKPRDGESVDGFIGRVAGPATTTWLVGPMLQGIYAAPPDRLSAQAVFGRRKSRSRGLVAPHRGMGEFVNRLFEGLSDRGVAFEWNSPAGSLQSATPTLVCTRAPAAASLIAHHAPDAAKAIARVSMSDAASVTAFFEPDSTDLQGFGALLPDADAFRALGVVFNTSLFAGRGQLRSETWIFGARSAGLDDGALVDTLLDERERLTRRRRQAVAAYPTRYQAALPVYNDDVLAVRPALATLPPWLGVSGNFIGRIGLADLIEQAEAAALELVEKFFADSRRAS